MCPDYSPFCLLQDYSSKLLLSLLPKYSPCVSLYISPFSTTEVFSCLPFYLLQENYLVSPFSTTGLFPLCFPCLFYWNIPPQFPLLYYWNIPPVFALSLILEYSPCVSTLSYTGIFPLCLHCLYYQTCKTPFFSGLWNFGSTDLAGTKHVNYDKFKIATNQRKSNI